MKHDQPVIGGPSSLGAQPIVHAHILAMFEAAQAAGTVPRDRTPLEGDDGVLWIEDGGGAVIAAAVFADYGNGRLWLDFLYVHAAHRRRGHGRALIRELKGIAAQLGFKKVMLGTGVDNHAMRQLALQECYAASDIMYTIAIGGARRS